MVGTSRGILTRAGHGSLLLGLFILPACSGRSPGNVISASGIIEAERIVVAAEVSGRLERMSVDEGDWIKKGDSIAELDSRTYADQVAVEAALLAAAEANLDLLRNGPRDQEVEVAKREVEIARENYNILLKTPRKEQLAQARAQVRKADAAAEQAEADYGRAKEVHAQGGLSDSDFERARVTYVAATQDAAGAHEQLRLLQTSPLPEEIERVKRAIEVAELHLKLLQEGSREEAIRQAQSQVEARRASLALAQKTLEKATLHAPINGRVVRLVHRAGEFLSPGSAVCELVDEKDLWLRVYVPEPLIGKVKIGASATLKIDALPTERIVGKVVAIDSEAVFTPSNIQTPEARATLVFGVKIQLTDNLGGRIKSGMPADAVIDAS